MRNLLIFIVSVIFSMNVSAAMVVIGHSGNAATLTETDVKKLFLGKKTSLPEAGKIQIVEFKDGRDERVTFHEKATGRTETQLQSAWSRLIFTGKANAPVQVNSDAEMLSEVAANPGAIGYVDEAAVTGDVKVLFRF